jgi:hypothetical protein
MLKNNWPKLLILGHFAKKKSGSFAFSMSDIFPKKRETTRFGQFFGY